MPSQTEHIRALVKAIGARAAINVLARRIIGNAQPVLVSSGKHIISLRPKDSDLFVAAQIFGTGEYDIGKHYRTALNRLAQEMKERHEVPVVIDGGANVGYSSLYLSDCFPSATVLAIEPDEQSFRMLQENCRAIDRVRPIHAALWDHNNGVRLKNISGPSWGRSVEEGNTTPSHTLESVLESVPHSRPLLLKLDIEGAEREVCLASSDVIRSFPCILLEPHDFMTPGAGCLTPLYRAISSKEMDTVLMGENIMLFDSHLASGGVPLFPPSDR